MQSARQRMIVVGLAGVMAGVLVTVGIFFGFGVVGAPFAASSSAVTLPDRIDEYRPFDQIELNRRPDAKKRVDSARRVAERRAAALSESFGGAAAAVQDYADAKYDKGFQLRVVRATAPSPQFVPYFDTEALGLAVPPNELLRIGEVSCEIVNNPPTIAGRKPDPDSRIVVSCQRVTRGLTVVIDGVRGDLRHQPQSVAKLVDLTWEQLG